MPFRLVPVMLAAAMLPDPAAIRALLDRHGDVNAILTDGSTALLWAARWDDPELVDRLLVAGANPRAANRYGVSPLLEASMNGDAAIIEKLLKAGADPNSAQPEGETALMTASRTGNVDAVRTLLDHGARINARETWRGQSALMWAAAEKHPAVVRLLIERGADVNARSRVFDYTHIQPRQGSVPMNYPRGGFTALLFAARQGDLETGHALIDGKADVNLADPDGSTPLLEAIVNFHYDFAAFLLASGADPNARDSRGRSPLYAAVDMHSLDTSTRPNPVVSDKLDSSDIIRALLAHHANPNAQLADFIPPRGPLDVADYTLGAGATPFLRAAKSDDLEVMRLLLASGADPLLATKAGVTPLMAAAGVGWRDGKSHGTEHDAIEAIQLCLDRGAGINAATDKGDNALTGASLRGSDTLISFLRSRGAAIDAKDKVVQTFSAKVSALGTSTNGHAPSTPASLACKDCTGTLTATASVPWLVITSVANGSIAFNVFSNTSTALRAGTIEVAGGSNKVTLTVEEAGSTAPLAARQVAYLYQRVLGREADAMPAGPVDIGRLAADLTASLGARETGSQIIAMHQAVDGSPPDYPTWLAAVGRLRNGTSAEAEFRMMFAGSACSKQSAADCIYRNLIGAAAKPAAAEPFTAFRAAFTSPEFQKQEHEGKPWRTLLYYLLTERAPTEAELADATSIAVLTRGLEFLAKFQ
ncbi:MAG TPA: ankyrin repeat domain-containing protein [Bryobacteraceae bacterium]|nr:ankyrin repeat domain-containing protein [Bryobacteraceae bacterium]